MPTPSMTTPRAPRSARILEQLGLHRPELRAWAMYDWANSAFVTTIIAAVFPAFFLLVPAAGMDEQTAVGYYGTATTISIVIAAILSPILGALADYRAVKKPLLGTFLGIGATACVMMFFIHHGDLYLALILFGVANIGVMGSFVLYESLLPHIASHDEIDRVSTGGYALGYLGGGLLLALNLAWILNPGMFGLPAGEGLSPAEQTLPTRLALASVGVWWAVFSIPLFRKVPEPPIGLQPGEKKGDSAIRVALTRLKGTFTELRRYKQAFLMLLAFFVFSDGIGTIVRMAVVYGAAIGLDRNAMILAILITQIVGFPFAFLFGWMAGRLGTKRSIFIGLFVYMGITVLAFAMTTSAHFILLAALVGTVQGGTQALSRSLFATLIPAHKSGEFFGFFGVMDRFSGSMGSGLMVLLVAFGAPIRFGILAVILFFIVGAVILVFVDVEEGRRAARESEARVRIVPPGEAVPAV